MIAPVAWLYFLIDWFIVDLERPVIGLLPFTEPIFNLKFMWFLGLAILLSYRFGRWTWAMAAYVIAWPVVLVGWKIPAFFWRRRSTALALAAVQAASIALTDLRFKLIVLSLWLAATTAIVSAPASPWPLFGALALLGLLGVSWLRGAVRFLRSSSFVNAQRLLIRRVLSAKQTKWLFELDSKYLARGVDRYEPNDAQLLMARIAGAVALNHGLLVWASQLEQYRRRYKPNLVFGAAALVGVYLSTVITLSVVNFGISRWEPSQFGIDYGDGSYMQFLLYSFSAMAGNGGGGIHPNEEIAMGMALLAGVFGVLIMAYLLATAYLVFRQQRDEEAIQALVVELRARADDSAREFRRQYKVSVDDARRRLEEFGFAFASFLTRLSAMVPESSEVGTTP